MTDFFNNSKLESFVDNRVDKKLEQLKKELKDSSAEKKLFTRKELKDYLRTTYPTIDRWSNAGLLTKLHVGSRVYFDSVEVYALLESKSL